MEKVSILSDRYEDRLLAALMVSVRQEMEQIVHEESARAAERVVERTKGITPRLVMQLMSNFDIHRDRTDYVIRVRQSLPTSEEAGA